MSVKYYSYNKNKAVSKHFTAKEFASKSGTEIYSKIIKIESKVIDILEKLYKDLNCSKIVITSGYRTASHDKAVGGSGKGAHTQGKAADFICYSKKGIIIPAKEVCARLESYKNVYGIGYISARAVHIDMNYRSKKNKWWGDETRAGQRSIWYYKPYCRSFYDYFKLPRPSTYKVGQKVEFTYAFKTKKGTKKTKAEKLKNNLGKIIKIHYGEKAPYEFSDGWFCSKKYIKGVREK